MDLLIYCTSAEPGLYIYGCTSTQDEEREKRHRQVASKPRQAEITQKQKNRRARMTGFHADFYNYVDRLPVVDAAEGHDFIVAIEETLFMQVVNNANRLRNEQTIRLMQIDPRRVPIIQVSAPLVAMIPIFAAIDVALLAILVALPAIAGAAASTALVPLAAESAATAAVAAPAAAGGATAVTSTGVTLTVLQGGATATAGATAAAQLPVAVGTISKAAAALIVAQLVAGGTSEAEAAEAVKPLIDKRIVSVLDVTNDASLSVLEAGGAMNVEGQTFRAIIKLTTRGDEN